MKKLLIIVVMVLLLLAGCSTAQKVSPEEQFKKSFSQHKYETFTKTPIPGVYEVYNGRQVYYYLPEGDVVLVGNMISRDNINLTQESVMKRMASKLTDLPLDQALKIGSGKTTVVEFIDPNCHYCRLSFNFFNARKKDITMYVFFHPLSEDSTKKIRHIACSKDKAAAYDDVLSGKMDGNDKLNLCTDQEAEEMLKTHQKISARVGIRATPLFYVKGQVVPGFDQPAIEQLLKE
ncbi:MAG: DsbC family protein [Deltaproteobacteria bacterium]